MKWLWRIWERLERQQGRGQRLVICLFLCAVVLFQIWVEMGYVLPSAEMELHRWERTNLLYDNSSIAFYSEEDAQLYLEEDFYVVIDDEMIVGLTENRAVTGVEFGSRWIWTYTPLGDGPAVTLFGAGRLHGCGKESERDSSYVPVLAFGLPKEAARGEIALAARSGSIEVTLTGPGREVGEGVWLFAASTWVSSWSMGGDVPYTLRLYRADGSFLLEESGTLR